MEILGMWIFIALIYFIPTGIAYDKNRKQKKAIFTLNLLTAWTVVGWIIAMVWANVEDGD